MVATSVARNRMTTLDWSDEIDLPGLSTGDLSVDLTASVSLTVTLNIDFKYVVMQEVHSFVVKVFVCGCEASIHFIILRPAGHHCLLVPMLFFPIAILLILSHSSL